MANSSIIGIAKKEIVREFIRDDEIVQAINSSTIKSPEKLIGTHIFDYHQNPNTINTVETFITIQVHIQESFYDRYASNVYINPTLEIWIISHEDHMIVKNIPKVTINRNDYLAELIDKKLNGKSGIGIGKLKLTNNIEGSYQQNYIYRKLTFQCTDLNDSLCKNE